MKIKCKAALFFIICIFSGSVIFSQQYDAGIFKERRENLAGKLSDGIIVMKSGTIYQRNNDVDYDFRQSSNFYYLTGFEEPESAFIIDPSSDKPYILFVKPGNPQFEIWDGILAGTEGAVSVYKADKSLDISEFENVFEKYISEGKKIYYPYSDKSLNAFITSLSSNVITADIEPVLAEMRLFKSAYEIEMMQKAIDITCDGLTATMKACKPGMYEYQLQAELEYIFKNEGSPRNGFPSIVGSGPNTTILHYETNRRKTEDGDLVVMDVGAEYGFYSADVTRTFPVNGKFSFAQKKIYNIVLAAQKQAIEFIKPGVRFSQVDSVARSVVKKGLEVIGLIKESDNTYGFFMHSTSHWLGLDVHDAGSYTSDGSEARFGKENRILEPGMVLTVEPGIYIREGKEGVDPEYYNIGIRIEDDVLVTQNGYNLLSWKAPKEIKDIEKLMRDGK